MPRLRRARILVPMLVALTACHFEVRPPTEAARDRDEIRAVVARLHDALGAGQPALAAGLFWDGATIALAPVGRRGWLVPAPEGLGRSYFGAREVTPVRSEVRLIGDRALAIVEIRVDPGTPAERDGTELVQLQRVAGVWRITHLSPAP